MEINKINPYANSKHEAGNTILVLFSNFRLKLHGFRNATCVTKPHANSTCLHGKIIYKRPL